jgi:hypothetical protein
MITDVAVRKLVFRGLPAGSSCLVLESFGVAINTPGAAVCQVLDTGKIKLLKKIIISSTDEKNMAMPVLPVFLKERKSTIHQTAAGKLKSCRKAKLPCFHCSVHTAMCWRHFLKTTSLVAGLNRITQQSSVFVTGCKFGYGRCLWWFTVKHRRRSSGKSALILS